MKKLFFVIAILFFAARPIWAYDTIAQNGNNSSMFGGGYSSGSTALTISGNNTMVIAAVGGTDTTGKEISGCTWNGNAMTEIYTRSTSSRQYKVFEYANGTGDGVSHNVTCTWTGGPNYGWGIVAGYYTNVKQTDLAAIENVTVYYTAGTMTTWATTSIDGSWLVGVGMGTNGSGSLSAGTSTTERVEANGSATYYDSMSLNDSGGAISPAGSARQVVINSGFASGALYVVVLEPSGTAGGGEGTTTPPWTASTTPATDSENLHYLVGVATIAIIFLMFDTFRRLNAGLLK